MAVKRAERLLRKNWASLQREAHRLAAEGLPVQVREGDVIMWHPLMEAHISIAETGEVSHLNFGRWEKGGVEDVARLLQDVLEKKQALADQAGAVAKELGKH